MDREQLNELIKAAAALEIDVVIAEETDDALAVDYLREIINMLADPLRDAVDYLAELAEEVTEALLADETIPRPKPVDFSCSCRNALRLDQIPWYTSGFQ